MTDHRGVAGMLDFLTAMVIVVGAVSVYFTATAVLLDSQDGRSHITDKVAVRTSERVVDDALRSVVGDDLLAPACTRALFETRTNRTCELGASGDSQTYLRRALGVDSEYIVNVTIADEAGVLRSAHRGGRDTYRHAVGPQVPGRGEVAVQSRVVSFGTDDDGDGRIDYYTAVVRVWEGD